MSPGTFRSLFDYCTSDAARLEKFYFRGLFEAANPGMLCFDVPGHSMYKPRFNVGAGPIDGDTLERTRAEVKRPINYHFVSGYEAPSAILLEWRRQLEREYGPP